jgi:hypothetical protein
MDDCCGISEDKDNKIGGFDKWKVRDAANTCIEAKEIEGGDAKFYAVVLKEVEKKAKAAMEAAETKGKAAAELKLEKKVGGKLKEVFGGKEK